MPRSRSKSKPRNYRSSRRSEAHDAAHAGDAPAARDLPDHPLILKSDPEFINTDADLANLAAHLADVSAFAYDTEFISEESYYPRICLVQIATAERLALIDPIDGPDLTPIWHAIANPDVETIVHAGVQDLEPLPRLIDRPPANIFDTQIAAGFTALPYPLGLTKLTQCFLDIELHKDFTFARWDKRPLSRRLQRYAADDVRFLPALREAIGDRLAALGHVDHARVECSALEQVDQYRFDANAVLPRVNGSRSLDERNLAVLREIVVLRNDAAMHMNLPPRTVLRDDVLLRLVKESPKSNDKLESIRGLPRPFQRDYGEQLIEAIARGRAIPKGDRPRRLQEDETPAQRFAIDSMCAAASALCHGLSIDPSMAFTRGEIATWYRAQVSGDSAHDARLETGWRKELIATRLRCMLNGNDNLQFCWEERGLSAS